MGGPNLHVYEIEYKINYRHLSRINLCDHVSNNHDPLIINTFTLDISLIREYVNLLHSN